MLCSVFVYGTLMPGHLRWGLVAPFATGTRPATVEGRAYDTHRGWPAARFRAPLGAEALLDVALGPRAVVHGWLIELAPSTAASALARLDEVEAAVVDDRRGPALGPGPQRDPGTAAAAGPSPARAPDGPPPEQYRRIRVRSQDGAEAWAYETLVVDPGWEPIDEWTDRAER